MYKNKYLKYKYKYLNFKNKLGGSNEVVPYIYSFEEYLQQQINTVTIPSSPFSRSPEILLTLEHVRLLLKNTTLPESSGKCENYNIDCKYSIQLFEPFFNKLYLYIFDKNKKNIIDYIDNNNNHEIIIIINELKKYCDENICNKNKLIYHIKLSDEENIDIESIENISNLTSMQKIRLKRILILFRVNMEFINIKFFKEFLSLEEQEENEYTNIFAECLVTDIIPLYESTYKVTDEEAGKAIFNLPNSIKEDCNDILLFTKKDDLYDITIEDMINYISKNIKDIIDHTKNVINKLYINDKISKYIILNNVLLRQTLFKSIIEDEIHHNIFINYLLTNSTYAMVYDDNDIIKLEQQTINLQEQSESIYYPNLEYYNINYFNFFKYSHELGHKITLLNNSPFYYIKINDTILKINIDDDGFPIININKKNNKFIDMKPIDLLSDIISTSVLINKLETKLKYDINREEIKKEILYIFNELDGNSIHYDKITRLYYNILLNDKMQYYLL